MSSDPGRNRQTIEAVAQILAHARSALFITGAGMSADSGLPTYRGIGGLYEERHTEEGLPIEVLLSGDMLRSRPALTWKYIAQIEAACRGALPNRGHEILAHLEQRLERCVVFTQNVDGLHRAAGSTRVIEIHGNIHDLVCTRGDWSATVPDYGQLAIPPQCPVCTSLVRPRVVLFGEALPSAPFTRFEAEQERGFDAVFSIGTSSLFSYVARPVLVAKSEGTPTIEINPGETDLSDIVDHRLAMSARDALRDIWAALRAIAPSHTVVGR
jgi:NAD-dependent deacetylase